MKFTDRGGVELRARGVARGRSRRRLVVAVTDTGRGIPAEALPHIFDRFYQADSSLTRSTEGTGLGLAISQNLARMMGGRIEVDERARRRLDLRPSAPSFAVVETAGEARDAA